MIKYSKLTVNIGSGNFTNILSKYRRIYPPLDLPLPIMSADNTNLFHSTKDVSALFIAVKVTVMQII